MTDYSDDGEVGGFPEITLRVNDADLPVRCHPDTPLLYALRNDLGLMGTRFGCGSGQCGACNVLVEGRPVHSCDTPVWSAQGRNVTTVEGLGGEELHPVQQAFDDHRSFQCGFCSSGIIITVVALLEQQPDADDAEVRAALDGNLCRCGAHLGILRAIRSLRSASR